MITLSFRHRKFRLPVRSEKGVHLVELLVGVIVGGLLLTSLYGSSMAMYRTSTLSQNEVLATNMGQQVIDNARNTTFDKLRALTNGGAASQDIPLYQYPTNPASAMFPRPLLRNDDLQDNLQFNEKTLDSSFNGTVTETLTDLNPADLTNGAIRVQVVVRWTDSRGAHDYSTETVISQTGIHN